MKLYNTPVLNPVKSPGTACVDGPAGRFQYELSRLSPDTELAKACVLDLASPLYDPGSLATWYDRSGKRNHGTVTGAVWKRLPSGLWYLDFDDVDNVDFGTSSVLRPAAWTVEYWQKTTQANMGSAICWTAGATLPLAGCWSETEFLFYLKAGNHQYFNLPYAHNDNKWHHFMATCPGSAQGDVANATVLMDGINCSKGAGAATATQTAKTNLFIGGTAGGYLLAGGIALYRLYNSVQAQAIGISHYQQERPYF